MSYTKFVGVANEIKGTSFTRSIYREDNGDWDVNETARYSIYDCNGTEVANGQLTKPDTKTLLLVVSKNVTSALDDGNYLLLVYLENTTQPDLSEIIAEYRITWKAPSADTCLTDV